MAKYISVEIVPREKSFPNTGFYLYIVIFYVTAQSSPAVLYGDFFRSKSKNKIKPAPNFLIHN